MIYPTETSAQAVRPRLGGACICIQQLDHDLKDRLDWPESWQSETGTSTARSGLHWLGLQQGWDLPLGLPLSAKQQSHAKSGAESDTSAAISLSSSCSESSSLPGLVCSPTTRQEQLLSVPCIGFFGIGRNLTAQNAGDLLRNLKRSDVKREMLG